MEKSGGDLHVVMLPWSAFGHLIPYYQLATALAKHGVRVSYIASPRNIERLPKIDAHLAHLVQYIIFPLPKITTSDLPQSAEATIDVDFDQIQYLKAAYEYDQVKLFVSRHSPSWIISDFAAYWLPEIARDCHVKLMFFSIFNATSLVFTGPPEYLMSEGQKRVRPTPDSLTTPPHWGSGIFPPTVAYRCYEAISFFNGLYSSNASGISDAERAAKIIQGCDAVCIRSCIEFEGEYLDLYQSLIHKPVVPVGVIPITKEAENKQVSELWNDHIKWLDQQTQRSVVYVAFGSEAKLSKDQVYEIAHGLELARLPFIWALRTPTWASDDVQALPPGFTNRTSGKGIVSFGWAPQFKILGHPSIGGSLFHSGASSVLETLQYGHSLILLPFVIDQGLVARMLVHKGLGIEVDRRADGSYTRDDIARALRCAMVGTEAETIRARVRLVSQVFSDEKLQQEHYIGRLVEFLRDGTRYISDKKV